MSNLKKEFALGLLYTGTAKYFGIFVSIVVSAILARLISPAEFGIVAIASIFITFFSTLTTVGISPAIIQNKTINEKELEEINLFTLLVAFVLTLLFYLSIDLISSLYDNNGQLKNVLQFLSISIFFSVAAIVPNAVLLKDKKFKFISFSTFAMQFIFGIVSVIAALLGIGIYALLINPIGSSIVLFIVYFVKRPIGVGLPQKTSINKIMSFSVYQMLFNLIYLLYRNVDKLVIGKVFNASNLGYYEKSYRLMLLPLENMSGIISPVLHPLLSEYQSNNEYLWDVYKKMITFLGEFSFIISVVLYYLAEPIILLLYGETWAPAVPIFKVLSLSICFQLIQAPIGAFFQAVNRVRDLMWCSLWVLLLMIVCIFVSVFLHNFDIFPSLVVVAFFLALLVYEKYISHAYNKSMMEIIKLLIPHASYAIVLFIILFLFECLIPTTNLIVAAVINLIASLCFLLFLLFTNRIENTKRVLYKSIVKIHEFKHFKNYLNN